MCSVVTRRSLVAADSLSSAADCLYYSAKEAKRARCSALPKDLIDINALDTERTTSRASAHGSSAIGEGRARLSLPDLPYEVLEKILSLCGTRELARLEATSKFFSCGRQLAKEQLKLIPRTTYLTPAKGESWLTLLRFAKCQSQAAAQSTALSLGSYHTAVLLSGRGSQYGLATFGRGFQGQLGHGNFDSAVSPKFALATQQGLAERMTEVISHTEEPAVVSCGGEHTAVISANGRLLLWGLGRHGENDRLASAKPQAAQVSAALRMVSVVAGARHTLALSENEEVWSCGENGCGQLGLGTKDECVHLSRLQLWGQGIVALAAGHYHSLALATDGSVWVWGSNKHGQLGLGSDVSQGALPSGAAPCFSVPQSLTSLNPAGVHPNQRVTAIAAGANHTMLITVAGGLLAFGNNKHGSLGLGDTCNRMVPSKVVLDHLVPNSEAPVRVVQVACGHSHTVVLAHCGGQTLVCTTGYNYFGELGLGDCRERARFTRVRGLAKKGIVAVASGDYHCAATTAAGELYVWGRGDCGQLGCGDQRHASTPKLLAGVRVVHPNVTLRRGPPTDFA